jgi:hypothetical protein
VRDDPVANHPIQLFRRVQQCRDFRACHVYLPMLQSVRRVQHDRRWPAGKNGFPPGA